jgi:hypothetical protein
MCVCRACVTRDETRDEDEMSPTHIRTKEAWASIEHMLELSEHPSTTCASASTRDTRSSLHLFSTHALHLSSCLLSFVSYLVISRRLSLISHRSSFFISHDSSLSHTHTRSRSSCARVFYAPPFSLVFVSTPLLSFISSHLSSFVSSRIVSLSFSLSHSSLIASLVSSHLVCVIAYAPRTCCPAPAALPVSAGALVARPACTRTLLGRHQSQAWQTPRVTANQGRACLGGGGGRRAIRATQRVHDRTRGRAPAGLPVSASA